jgi:hypothetical protein
MERDGIDLSQIVWYEGDSDPEPCAVCGRDTRAASVERATFCGCVYDADGNIVKECDCRTNELLICGPCQGEAIEGMWG